MHYVVAGTKHAGQFCSSSKFYVGQALAGTTAAGTDPEHGGSSRLTRFNPGRTHQNVSLRM
jgi:hypothetical protein